MKLYGDIIKVIDQDDGTIICSGIASTGVVDDAGETVTPAAMKAALPGYMAFGAVREMHGLSAAGTALKAWVDDAGVTHLETHVVDPVAVLKVKTNVYKGFSIGGKVLARDPNDRTIITALKLNEISLVDRPCNPEAVIGMWKAEGVHLEEETVAGSPDDIVDRLNKAMDDLFAAVAGRDAAISRDTAGLGSLAATISNFDMRLTKLGAPREPDSGSMAAMLKALPGQPELTVQALCGLVDDLKKRLEIAEAVPAPPKCAVGTFAISKAQDVNPGAGEPIAAVSAEAVTDYLASLSEDERALVITKAALARPMRGLQA